MVISATAKCFRYADIGQSGLEQNTSGRQWKVHATFPIMHGTSSVGLNKYTVIHR